MGFNAHFWPFRGVCHVYAHICMHTIFILFIACTNITATLYIGLIPCKLAHTFIVLIVLNRLVRISLKAFLFVMWGLTPGPCAS